MKKYLILTILTILSFRLVGQLQDDSILNATVLIKNYVTTDIREVTNIEIVNAHNGRYTITSSLQVNGDSIRLRSYIVDMTGGKRDTTINLSKQSFLLKLDKASIPSNSMKLAGHHQTISIRKGDKEKVIETIDGRALMNLLEYGE
jgi:hypothetical protein